MKSPKCTCAMFKVCMECIKANGKIFSKPQEKAPDCFIDGKPVITPSIYEMA